MKDIPHPAPDFDVYINRPGTRYGAREGEALEAIYGLGYLPYSGTKDLCGIFYTARGARVRLTEFEPTSENRRIGKRFDGRFSKERVPIDKFRPDEAFWEFCLSYFREKHGERAMPKERLATILACGVTTVVIYRDGESIVAYVLEVEDGSMAHFWQSFYALSFAKQSLGLWLMLDCIRDAKERGLAHYYLGTVYGPHALYKTNFEPLEWWDGELWSADLAKLKDLSRAE